jgi:dTDP-4-amino-4,6-dideoxygalactose transaminase
MVTTNDSDLAHRVRILRDHGSPQRYYHQIVGLNGRLDEIQAAILRAKLPHLENWNEQRRAHAARYAGLLADIEGVITPDIAPYAEHVFHLYVVRVARRDHLRAYLRERDIGAGVHYPVPCHLQPAFQHLGYKSGDLPVTEKVVGEILSLPMYAELTDGQQIYVADAICEFYG